MKKFCSIIFNFSCLKFMNYIGQRTALFPYTFVQTDSTVLQHSFQYVCLNSDDLFSYGDLQCFQSPRTPFKYLSFSINPQKKLQRAKSGERADQFRSPPRNEINLAGHISLNAHCLFCSVICGAFLFKPNFLGLKSFTIILG